MPSPPRSGRPRRRSDGAGERRYWVAKTLDSRGRSTRTIAASSDIFKTCEVGVRMSGSMGPDSSMSPGPVDPEGRGDRRESQPPGKTPRRRRRAAHIAGEHHGTSHLDGEGAGPRPGAGRGRRGRAPGAGAEARGADRPGRGHHLVARHAGLRRGRRRRARATSATSTRSTQGAEKIDGLFTLHKKGDHLYAEIRHDQFNQPLLLPDDDRPRHGPGRHARRRRRHGARLPRVGDRVQLVRRNIHYKAPSGTPLDKSVKQNYTDSILMALPIVAHQPDGAAARR